MPFAFYQYTFTSICFFPKKFEALGSKTCYNMNSVGSGGLEVRNEPIWSPAKQLTAALSVPGGYFDCR